MKVIAIFRSTETERRLEVVHEVLPGETVEHLIDRLLVTPRWTGSADSVLLKIVQEAKEDMP